MKDCDVCKMIEKKDAFHVIHEDDLCLAVLHEAPAVAGHTIVFPKKHCPIFEELDDETVKHIFVVANKLSTVIFDTLQFHGTNLIVNNGLSAGQELPHFMVNIIPRTEKDNLNFEWTPFKKSDQELNVTQDILKNALKPKTVRPEQKAAARTAPKEDLMAQRLRRIP